MEQKGFSTLGKDLLMGKAKKGSDNFNSFNVKELDKPITIPTTDSKISVLVIPSDSSGVGKYRSIDPHKMLHKLYGDEFYIDINPNPDYADKNYFKRFAIVHIHKAPSNDYTNGVKIVNDLKALGCKVIVDNDDYWGIESTNSQYKVMKLNKTDEKFREIMQAADWVTTTTPIFADEIRGFNKNVVVIPNSIDPSEPQFIPKPVKSDRIRIGFLGGSTHFEDLRLMNGVPNVFLSIRDKIQMVLIGFDLRGKIKQQMKDGTVKSRDMRPEETIWAEYEKLFTSNWQLLSEYPDYARHLQTYTQNKYEGEKTMPYRRIWTRDINNYAHNYNHLDISLAPLVENKFNLFKSQLKVVEAGFHKKALIAQDFGAYTLDLTNVFDGSKINPKGNAILIDSRKNHKQWAQSIKRLINNPEIIQMMGENLNEMVMDRFDLTKVTKTRAEFYRSII